MREPKIGDIWSYWWGNAARIQREYFLITGPEHAASNKVPVLSLHSGVSDHMLFCYEYRGYWRFEV